MKGCTDRRKPEILYGKEEDDKPDIEGRILGSVFCLNIYTK